MVKSSVCTHNYKLFPRRIALFNVGAGDRRLYLPVRRITEAVSQPRSPRSDLAPPVGAPTAAR